MPLLRQSSAKSKSARRPSASLQYARSGKTAIAMKAEMWLMPVHEFVALPRLRPHQELLAQKKLVRWDSSMRNVFFLSHQWTSFREPDHSLQQLRTFQRLLTRMICGLCPDTAPAFADAALFPSSIRITSAKWQTVAKTAFIWLDYFSVRP